MPEETVVEPRVIADLASKTREPRLVSFLFFDYANETTDRKVNLLGLFDRLYVDQETKRTVPVGIFVRTGNTFDSPVNVQIADPEGKVVGGFSFEVSRAQAEKTTKIGQMQIMARIQFNTPVVGTYWFQS
jgi:hypothetical protein